MTLSDRFRQEVGHALRLEVPDNAYVAMDYHLDWLSAAYHFASKGGTLDTAVSRKEPYGNYPNNKGEPILAGSILDADLLIAYRRNDQVVVILVEAKADTGWSASQIADKASRLRSVFYEGRNSEKLVDPYFLLLGPPRTSDKAISKDQVDDKTFPSWFFIKDEDSKRSVIPYLSMYPDRPLYVPTRTQGNDGHYNGWQVVESKLFQPDSKPEDQ